jgi:hypothetical protein
MLDFPATYDTIPLEKTSKINIEERVIGYKEIGKNLP